MTACHQIDSLVTPYVDGDLGAAERDIVERHLGQCRSCRGRVHGEQAVHALMRARRSALAAGEAPGMLRARCAALGQSSVTVRPAASWRARAVPFALAASLVLIVGGAFLYELTERSTRVMAAELIVDHVKCFRLLNNTLGTHQEAATVESAMVSGFGWHVQLPAHPELAGLELVGARRCVYAEGRTAHLMYRHNGTPVSIFMLPRTARADDRLEVMGHQATIWSVGNRTFVLIAREPRTELDRVTAFVHSALR
jgi:anti-sigma factor RsiW